MKITTNHSFWLGLTLICLAHLLVDFMLGVWPVYKTIAQLDLVIAGLIASIGVFIGEGMQLYFGYLSDRGHHQRVLALGIALTVTIPLLIYIENQLLLFIMVLCAFIGSGAFHPSGTGIVMAADPSKKNLLIALFACGGMIGAASSQIIYTFLYYHSADQIWYLSLLILPCFLGCAFFPFPNIAPRKRQKSFKEILEALKPQKFKIIMLYVIHVLLQIVMNSFAFLLPDILMAKGYEQWFCLGGGYFCFILGSILTSIPIGYCIDRLGYRLVLAAVVLASTGLLYLFLGLEALSLTPPILLLLALGGTMGVIIPIVISGGTQNIPDYTRSFVSALYMGGTTCIAGFGPMLASLLASFFGEQGPIIALQGLNLLFLLSLGLMYYLPDSLPISKPQRQVSLMKQPTLLKREMS